MAPVETFLETRRQMPALADVFAKAGWQRLTFRQAGWQPFASDAAPDDLGVKVMSLYTSHSATASRSDVSGSRVGVNSWAM